MSVSSGPADFTALYTEHLDFVWRNLRALGVAVADLDDATQDTFVVAYRRRADFDDGASMRGWLYGIARRVAWRQRRGGGRRRRLEDAVAAEPTAGRSLVDEADDRDALRTVQRFLVGLPEAQREVYWLSELEGLTAAQVGAAMGISPNTVSSRLRTARAAFARYTEVLRAQDEGVAQRLARAARRQANPSQAQRRQVASALALQWGSAPAAAATLGTFAGAKLWLITAAAAVAVGTAAVAAGRAAAPAEPDAAQSDPSASVVGAQASARAPAPVRTPSAAGATAKPPTPEPPYAEGSPRDAVPPHRASRGKRPMRNDDMGSDGAAMTVSSSGGRPLARSTPHERADAESDEAAFDSSAAAEAELVRSMRLSLASDPGRALRLAAEHARRFPKGMLSLEARAMRVQSLCALDRETDARAAARSLGASHPWGAVGTDGCSSVGKKDPRDSEKPTNTPVPGEGGGV